MIYITSIELTVIKNIIFFLPIILLIIIYSGISILSFEEVCDFFFQQTVKLAVFLPVVILAFLWAYVNFNNMKPVCLIPKTLYQ